MAEHLQPIQEEILQYKRQLAKAKNSGILEAIRDAQERLARVLRVRAAMRRAW